MPLTQAQIDALNEILYGVEPNPMNSIAGYLNDLSDIVKEGEGLLAIHEFFNTAAELNAVLSDLQGKISAVGTGISDLV
jgi:hypothetical protein